ncbi:MAG TPA: transcriptional repressor LexA [Polyangia bacterium]|nr:transcriptional repressor LexA [Polyangia bacterium]
MAPKTPPGQTRNQIHRFVRQRLLAGRPPTVREVQSAFGFRSVQSAREHLEGLVADGRLAKEPGVSRGYRLPDGAAGFPAALVPVLGQVQAGALTTAVEDPEEGFLRVEGRPDGEDLFALRVRGESMTGAGILPGDLVIARRQPDADHGDIVVALVDDEATVKTLFKRGRRVELRPANPGFEPIVPDPSTLRLLGRVIEVRRRLDG